MLLTTSNMKQYIKSFSENLQKRLNDGDKSPQTQLKQWIFWNKLKNLFQHTKVPDPNVW